MSGWKLTLLLLLGVLGLAGGAYLGSSLAGGGVDPEQQPSGDEAVAATTVTTEPRSASETATTRAPADPTGCDIPDGEPFVGGPATPLMELGEVDGLLVEGAIYPHPAYEAELWTQWGQGIALEDGRFFSAIGDHIGPDGNSYIYEYDPDSGTLATIGDILSYVDHQPGSWGYGKVHGQMVAGPCGEIYFSSYWGTNNGLQFGGSYSGDILFRLDPFGRTIANLGVPIDVHGVPSLAASPDDGLVYGEAIDPIREAFDIDEGPFFAYDVVAEQLVFEGPATPHEGYRNILVDSAGRAYYSIGAAQLARYDPVTNSVDVHGETMPGDWLRASTLPAPSGRVFAVTEDPARFFALEPDGRITGLGDARGYTTSMVVHPDGDRFFYVPDAHGSAWARGAPLISVDGSTGEQTVLAQLNPLVEATLGVRLGGTYDIAMAPSGDRLFIGMNVGPLGADNGFGEVALLIVHLP